jgi:hypothetical protein
MSSVSAFGNGLAPKSALVFVENMWLTPDMARRVIYAFARIRARGATIRGNQGYRWKGIASDRRIGALGLGEELTSDGTGNQFYQKGREDAGYTPSAATPGFSNHGDGNSVDTDCSSLQIRDEEFAKVGLRRDIPSETWHATIFRDPSVDLSGISVAGTSTSPFDNTNRTDDDEMLSPEAQTYINQKFAELISVTLRSDDTIVYGWDQNGKGEGPIAAFGSSWHESGIGEPDRSGNPGRYLFATEDEYKTAKVIFDTSISKGQPAPYLPPFNEVVFLALPNWVLVNKLRQTPVDPKTGE